MMLSGYLTSFMVSPRLPGSLEESKGCSSCAFPTPQSSKPGKWRNQPGYPLNSIGFCPKRIWPPDGSSPARPNKKRRPEGRLHSLKTKIQTLLFLDIRRLIFRVDRAVFRLFIRMGVAALTAGSGPSGGRLLLGRFLVHHFAQFHRSLAEFFGGFLDGFGILPRHDRLQSLELF